MTLERELETFQRELPYLLLHPENHGKYALVQGDHVDGVWPSVAAALEIGYERHGLKPFLVKEVTEREEPRYFSHNVTR